MGRWGGGGRRSAVRRPTWVVLRATTSSRSSGLAMNVAHPRRILTRGAAPGTGSGAGQFAAPFLKGAGAGAVDDGFSDGEDSAVQGGGDEDFADVMVGV